MDRLTEDDITELSAICPGGIVRDLDLSAVSQWQIGGRADIVLRPTSTTEVGALLQWFSSRKIRPAVIGLTSNLLFSDHGLRAPVLQISSRMAGVSITELEVRAQAGIWVPCLARRLMQARLSGGEHVSGIPGSLGGLICMNGGSQRKGIGSNVVAVESVDTQGVVRQREAKSCGFAYRKSIYQTNDEVITGVVMRFAECPSRTIRKETQRILADRRRKFPRKQPNCGSVFISDPDMYAQYGPPGAIIEKLGLKGRQIGGAQISPLHANFIVNKGQAKSADVLALIHEISHAAARELGVTLRAEVRYVAPDGSSYPASDVPAEKLGEGR